jgi:hydrogenase nickel incorporation protein HypA/HybF
MHEVAIAANIIKIAEEELKKNNGTVINKLHLEVGKLSGIVVESLRFAMEVAGNNSIIKQCEIKIDEIPARAICRSCHHEFEAMDFYVVCPKCQDIQLDFVGGKELLIKSIVIS